MEFLTVRVLAYVNLLGKISLLVDCLFCSLLPALGQDLVRVVSIPTSPIDKVSIDRQGNIYVCDEEGLIYKYSPEGEMLVNYSPVKTARITQIEAWQGLRVIVFYADYQEFVLLDRFLRATDPYQLDPDEIGFGRTGTLSNDNNVWIVDDSDYSLKKIDVARRALFQDNDFSFLLQEQVTEINYIREYKNLLYLNDFNSGILVFDNLGNFLHQMAIPGLDYYGFAEDELYYLTSGYIKFHNLYSGSTREIGIRGDEPIKFVLLSQERLFLIADNYFKIFRRPYR